MRAGWEIKTIGDVCDIFDRKRKPISKRDREPGPYPYYGASCIQDYVSGYLFDGRYLLIGEDGAKWGPGEDTAYIAEGKFWVNNHAHIVKAKEGYLDDYLRYYIKHLDLNPIVAGAIIPKLTQEKLAALEVPIPSLTEQQRIVDILDREFAKIDALKANAEKSLQAAKDLFQATLKKELEPKEGWRTEPFGEVCQYYKEQGLFPSLRYIGMENIEAESGTLLGTMSGEQVQSSSFHFYPGDVLYGRLRPYLKKVIVADFEGCCSTEIFPVRSKKCIPGFLQYWFLADDTTNRINATCSGCRMPRANMKDVLSFEISFPGEKEQAEVVQRIKTLCDNAKALQDNYQKTLSLCDDLKQSILRKAFNGEL